MKVLVTGISGFAGNYLSDLLKERGGYEVFGVSHSGATGNNEDTRIFQGDLLNKNRVEEIIGEVKPDYIYHLAALSSPRKSFDNPDLTITNNVNSQVNILEAIRKFNLDTRILVISSADIYGVVDERYIPIDEDAPLNPTNPYAVSKITQDFLALQYFNAFNMQVIRVRPFNYTGPKQTDLFVIPAFCKRIVEAKKAEKNSIVVGNLKAKRDFTDVRDMVRAFVLAAEKGIPGDVYNIGSGVSRSMEEIVDKLIQFSGAKIDKEVDKSLLLPLDNPNLVANYTKFHQLTGWTPEISFDQTLHDTLDYWSSSL